MQSEKDALDDINSYLMEQLGSANSDLIHDQIYINEHGEAH